MTIKDFLIERYYAKYEFSTPYMLSSSDAESITIKELLQIHSSNAFSILENFDDLYLGYTQSQGDPKLRSVIADLYVSVSKEEIIVFSGAEEGIFNFMNQFSGKDHIIVQYPCYQSSYEVAKYKGVSVSHWVMEEENQWKPDLVKLESLISDETSCIVINSPHNPTGYNFTIEELHQIVAICKKYDLYLFSDEVYRLGEYDEKSRLPNATDVYHKAVSLGVLSKPMGLPGLRIGWIATKDSAIFQQMLRFKDYTTICNSAPSEFLATVALENREQILGRNIKIIQNNLNHLRTFMVTYSDLFSWVEPTAGTIGFIKIHFSDDVESFCLDLITEKGILLLPSTTYQFGSQHFRIGFGRKNFIEALNKLEEYVRSELL